MPARCGRADMVRALETGGDVLLPAMARLTGFEPPPTAPDSADGMAAGAGHADTLQDELAAREPQPEPVQAPDRLPAVPFWRPVHYRYDGPNEQAIAERAQEAREGQEAGETAPGPRPISNLDLPDQPPDPEPLARWPALLPRLRRVVAGNTEGKALDIEAVVRALSCGRPLHRLPRRRQMHWGSRVQVISDRSVRLTPYWSDQDQVGRRLKPLFPRHGFEQARVWGGGRVPKLLDRGVYARAYRLPAPGSLVIVLGDLGDLALQPEAPRRIWRRFGRRLRDLGCRLVVLTPAPRSRWEDGASPWHRLVWERPALASDAGAGGSAAARADHLLMLAAPAVRLEPGLLREIRRQVATGRTDAGTEADVWQHAAVASRSSVAATLAPEAAARLRQAFAEQPLAVRQEVLRLIRKWRTKALETVWYEDLWGLDQATLDALPPAEVEASLAFLDWVCALFQAGDAVALPAGARRWLQGMERRLVTDGTCLNPTIERQLHRLVEAAHRHDPDWRPPATLEPGEIPPDGVVERLEIRQHATQLEVRKVGPTNWRDDEFPGLPPVRALAGAGRLLGHIDSGNGYLRCLVTAEEGDSAHLQTLQPASVLRLSAERPSRRLTLPQSGFLLLRSDREALTVEALTRPGWAAAIGRDGFGLWTEIKVAANSGPPVVQRLRWIPPGRFLMGSPEDEPDRFKNEGPQHAVTIGRGFWLFDTACTQALWEAVMGNNPSRFNGPDRPVEGASWDDVQRFLERINGRMNGLTLDVPSEAEWEYACRAGTTTAFSFGGTITTDQVNYKGKARYDAKKREGHDRKETVKVGSLPANPWGLYEMHGNVWEWCADHWHADYQGAPVDGSAWIEWAGGGRVIRGGAWRDTARYARSAYRYRGAFGYRYDTLGFRCCARVQV